MEKNVSQSIIEEKLIKSIKKDKYKGEFIYITQEISDGNIISSKDGEPMIGIGRANDSNRRASEHHYRGSKASAGIIFIDENDFKSTGYTAKYIESKLHEALVNIGFRNVDRESYFNNKMFKKSKTEVYTGKSKLKIEGLINVGDILTKDFIWNLCKYILDNPNLFKIKFEVRFHQALITNKFLDVIDNKKLSSKLLSELCARFGKTNSCLYLLLKMNEDYGTRVMILPGYVHSSFSSYKKEIDLYNDFNNIVYIDTKKDDYEILFNKSLEEGKLIVIPCSLQVSDKDKFTFLKNYDSNKKIIVIDEADYGAHTNNSNEIIEYLDNGCVRIHTSGTSIDRAGKNLKVVDGIINFSYFELLQSKRGLSKYFEERYLTELHPIINKLEIDFLKNVQNNKEYWKETLSSIPDIDFYKINVPEKCLDNIKKIDKIYMTNWSKILEDPIKNKNIIESLLKGLFGLHMDPSINKIDLSRIIYKDSEKKIRCVHFFTGCRSNEKLEKLSKIFKETLKDYNIITLSGNNGITNETAEKKVKDLIEKTKEEGKEGVIIISVDMGARSFSVSEIEAVILMYDGGLVSQTIQKTSKTLTGGKDYNGDYKMVGNVVSLSFDSNRIDPIDQVILEESLKNKSNYESVESAVRKLIMSVNIFSILDDETGDCIEINKEDLITKFIQNTDYKRVVVNSVDYTSLLKNDEDILDGLDSAKTSKQSKNKLEKLLPSGKKFLDKNESSKVSKKDEENEYKKIEIIREVVNMILNSTSTIKSIDTSDIYSMNNKKSFIQILKSIKSDEDKNNEFIETFGIDSEILIKMCERKRINGDLIDLIMNEIKTIYDIPENIFKTSYQNVDIGHVLTPPKLALEMIETLPSNFIKKRIKILDPACKNGSFLFQLVIKQLDNDWLIKDIEKSLYTCDTLRASLNVAESGIKHIIRFTYQNSLIKINNLLNKYFEIEVMYDNLIKTITENKYISIRQFINELLLDRKNNWLIVKFEENLIEFIKKYEGLSKTESKLFGEVFTPQSLIEEMLDTLPDNVWSNKDLKWLDPAVGVGNFPAAILNRLMGGLKEVIPNEDERRKHILEEMLYMGDISTKNLFLLYQLFDQNNEFKLNVFRGDFLGDKFDKHMKDVWGLDGFDLVVGNPPYQHPTNKRWKQWISFIDKISKMNNKYLLFITPIAWMNGEGEELNNAKNIINNKGITYINIDCNEYFNVGEKIGYYLCNGDKNDEVIISNMGKEIKIKNDGKFLLDDISILKDSIFNKMKSDVKFNFLNINTDIKSKINNGTFSRDKTEKNNTRVIHSASNIFYCSEDFLDLKKEGVIVNWSGHFYKENDSKYLFRSIEDVPGRNTKKILTNNKNESSNLIRYISSKLIRFYVNSKKTSGFNTPLFDIPKVDLSKSWTDEDLYQHFNLTPEEIKLIEETIQETNNKKKSNKK